MARKTRNRNRKLTPLSNPYIHVRRRRSSRRRTLFNDTELNVRKAIRHKSPILRATTKDTTFNDKIISVIKKKTHIPYTNILDKLQPNHCKRRSFKKVMMRKLAAQILAKSGAGAVLRWRDKLTRQERYTKC